MQRQIGRAVKSGNETTFAAWLAVGRLLLEPSLPPKKRPQIQPQQPSGLLERLQSFLPGLEAANAKLNGKQASEISIERTGNSKLCLAFDGICPVTEYMQLLKLVCGLRG